MSDTSRAIDAMFASLVRQLGVAFLLIGVVGCGLGYVFAEREGLIGGAMGLGVTVFFMGTSVVVAMLTAKYPIQISQAAFVGAWIVKVLVLFVVLALVRGQDFYDRFVFFGVLVVTIVVTTALEMRAIAKARVPNVETSERNHGQPRA